MTTETQLPVVKTDAEKEKAFNEAKAICKSCGSSGEIYHNGSYYGCSHGLSYEERSFNNRVY